jgi:phosphoserine phosphatase RsbU/P
MVQIEPQQRALACMEVLGSNRSTIQTVELPDLRARVYSRPMGAEIGGDVHYLSVCGQAVLSRVVLADVSGHGNHVSNSAQLLHALMRAHINTWDQTEFVQGLNQSFRDRIARGKHATAVILGILRGTVKPHLRVRVIFHHPGIGQRPGTGVGCTRNHERKSLTSRVCLSA